MTILKNAYVLAVIISIIFSFYVIGSVSADDTIENIVEARFNIEIDSATDFKITAEVTVSKLTLTASGTTYTGSEISTIAASNLETLGAIKYVLREMIFKQIDKIFTDAVIIPVELLPSYENEKFYDNFNVNLTTLYFGINKTINVYDFVNGVLDMGARIHYNFNFVANIGWNNIYSIDLGESYFYNFTDGAVDNTIIEWTVRNEAGLQSSKTGKMYIFKNDPTTSASNVEDIFLEFLLDARGDKTSFTTNINANKIDITEYNILPDFITKLTHVPSDGIRLFVENNLTTWEEIYQNTIKPIQDSIQSTIATSKFNQTLDITFNWQDETTTNIDVPFEIGNMDDSPPVKTTLFAENVKLRFYDMASKALFGLVNTGAIANVSQNDINFGDKLVNLGYPYNITLMFPSEIQLAGDNTYTWNDTIAFSGGIISDDPPSYKNEEIETIIQIEVQSTDLNLLSFFTGTTELTFGLNLEESRDYNVFRLPDELDLPNKLSIQYLNSDAFRLCTQENVFTSDDVNTFLDDEKNHFQIRMATLFPGLEITGNTERETYDNSLQWDKDISNMDADTPIKTESYANCMYPIGFDFSVIPPGFTIPVQNYSFTGIQNQSVTYRMIFPNGVDLECSDSSDKSVIKELEDERKYIEISFTPLESELTVDVSCKIIPSLLFIIGVFMPCIISFFITIILIIMILLIRKKRKGRKVTPAVTAYEEEDTGYEGEDYYIPPPPGSK
jgi:hypothetical protein